MRACHIVGNLFGAQHRAFMFSAKIGSAAAPHTVIVRRDFRQQTKSRCFSACEVLDAYILEQKVD
jgi:hypothetical protein